MKKLGFGLMRLPRIGKEVDIELTKKMVDEFIKRGFTYFDTAWMYCDHKSECAVKECIVDRYPREAFTVTSKLPDYELQSLEDRDRIFNTQKQKTGLEYFDYYWLHNVNSKSLINFEKYDCFNFIREKKNKGEVKHIGFSYHDGPELLDELLTKYPDMEYVQLQINYLDWEAENVQSRKCYEVCVKHNKPVIIMEPVKGGQLVKLPNAVEEMFKNADPNMSMPSWAIRFGASLDNVFMVLSGMSNYEQLLDNLSYMEDFKPLSEEEHKMCLKAGEIIKEVAIIPCTGCSYCTEKCPVQMPIPKYFAAYNASKQKNTNLDYDYTSLANSGARPSDCLDCGQCEDACPQHLKIRKYLKDVDEYYKN